MTRAPRMALLTLLATLCSAPGAGAQTRGIPPGLLIVLEGYTGARRPNDWETTNLWLYSQGDSYQFQLKKVRVINSGILPSQIVNALIPYRPSLLLYGKPAVLARLENAAAGDTLAITGYTSGTRQLQVSEMVVSPPTLTPVPATPAASPSASAAPAPSD